jgi:hypothetical protein
MRIKVGIVGMKNTTVEYVLDPVMDKAELENVTPKNMAKVGLAIARRRLAKLNLVPYPIAITA